MVELRGIHASLFVTLLLQFTGVTGQNETFIVGAGGEVTLPCGNVIKHQDRCEGTAWIHSRWDGDPTREWINLGKVQTTMIPQKTSDRLSLTSTCSLVIKNVMDDDRGRFTCRQFDKSGKKQGEDAEVHLSVLTMYKDQMNDSVSVFCSVLTYTGCGYTVKWLYDDGDENVPETLPAACSTRITLKYPQFNKMSIKCSVTDDQTGQTLLCDVKSQSCEQTAKGNKSAESEPEKNKDPPPSVITYVAPGLVALLIIAVVVVVVVVVKKKTKGKKTQTDEHARQRLNTAVTQETGQDLDDPEDGGVSYASVSYVKNANGEARVCRDGGDGGGGEAVTYATVKAPSSVDPSALYATVQK